MEYYGGLDVSLERTAICVLDGEGAVAWQGWADTHPEMIAHVLDPRRPPSKEGLQGRLMMGTRDSNQEGCEDGREEKFSAILRVVDELEEAHDGFRGVSRPSGKRAVFLSAKGFPTAL